MNKIQGTLERFEEFTYYINSLKKIDSNLLTEPINKNKWSSLEIIAHIQYWDRYLANNIIPSLQKGDKVSFPNHDDYNKNAVNYVKSEETVDNVLKDTIMWRDKLIKSLKGLSDLTFNKPIVVNNNTNCPITGTQYTLLYLINEFIDHDLHHLKQVEKKLDVDLIEQEA